jgi:predicted HicB family RNase H-like nuclease
MKDVIKYKGFIGSVHFDSEDEIFHGKVEGIPDLVTFEGQSVGDLKKAFQDAIEDYLALCKETGKEPVKSCKGSFNVRIPPELHIEAVMVAKELGVSLNDFVRTAVQEKVSKERHCA